MELAKALKRLFPEAKENKDFVLMDNGQGPFIAEWHLNEAKPTQAELNSAWNEYQLSPDVEPISEIEVLKKNQELMQAALDELLLGGGL